MNPYQVALAMVQGKWRLDIPKTVILVTEELVRDVLARDDRHRPLFSEQHGRRYIAIVRNEVRMH
jgi:hypothetical protein